MKRNSTGEIYSVIQYVIKKEALDKNHGLDIIPDSTCNIHSDDSIYLRTLLIKPKPVDTTDKSGSSGFIVSTTLSMPYKNILTAADINYMLKTKKIFAHFEWDNNQLGFNMGNKELYYTFSMPYFNLAHDKAIIMYRFHCFGLCGADEILLLNKTSSS